MRLILSEMCNCNFAENLQQNKNNFYLLKFAKLRQNLCLVRSKSRNTTIIWQIFAATGNKTENRGRSGQRPGPKKWEIWAVANQGF